MFGLTIKPPIKNIGQKIKAGDLKLIDSDSLYIIKGNMVVNGEIINIEMDKKFSMAPWKMYNYVVEVWLGSGGLLSLNNDENNYLAKLLYKADKKEQESRYKIYQLNKEVKDTEIRKKLISLFKE